MHVLHIFPLPLCAIAFENQYLIAPLTFGNKFDQEVAAAAEVTAVATAAKQRARILEMQAAGQMMS